MTLNLSGLVQAVDFDGDHTTLANDLTVSVADDTPDVTAATATGSVDEGGLRSTAAGGTDTFGNGNDSPTTIATFTSNAANNLNNLVNFGADGPNATPFQFVGGTSAVLAALGIHSHGMLVDTATLSNGGHTLTASASGDGHTVFSLTINNDGSWSFSSLGPIDHALGDNTEAPVTLNLSGLVQAVDFDGDHTTLANDLTVSVADDTPDVTAATATGSVDEGGLRSTAAGGTDTFGNGNDSPTTIATFTSNAANNLNNLVNFGADGPNATPFQFVGGTSAVLAALGIHSHGMLVDTATLSNGGHTLTASASGDGHTVFSLTINNDGSWSFSSLGPIDHALGDNTEAPVTLNLSGLVQAVDFDGDHTTLANA